MKKLLLVSCVFVCLAAALPAGTQYTITEAELEMLESISTALEEHNQSLLQQVQVLTNNSKQLESKAQSLKQKLQTAQMTSKSLNELLQAERVTSQSLRASFNAYEKEVTQIRQALIDEKLKRQKIINQRNVCLSAAILQALVTIGFIILKIIIWAKHLV